MKKYCIINYIYLFILIKVNMLFNSLFFNLKHIAYAKNLITVCWLELIALKINYYSATLFNVNKYHKILKYSSTRIK